MIEKEQPIAVEVLNVKELCTKEQIVPEREKSVTRGRSVVRALSQVRDIIARETSVTRDASGSRERGRALSHIRDIIMRDQSGTREHTTMCKSVAVMKGYLENELEQQMVSARAEHAQQCALVFRQAETESHQLVAGAEH